MHEQPLQPEITSDTPLEQLPALLGFKEDDALLALRSRIDEVIGGNDAEALTPLILEYSAKAYELVDRADNPEYPGLQLSLNVVMALLWKQAGQADRYLSNIDDALDIAAYTRNAGIFPGYAEIADVIRPVYKAALAAKKSSES